MVSQHLAVIAGKDDDGVFALICLFKRGNYPPKFSSMRSIMA